MANVPNFDAKRQRLQPVKFLPVQRAFSAQVQVRALRDINGWVDRKQRVKWHIAAGSVVSIDEHKAREFAAKGYVDILNGKVKPVSSDEAAELLSSTTTIGIGVS